MTVEGIRAIFGERLRRLRIVKLKLGQLQAANRLDIEVSKLNKWEHGISIPDAQVLCQLAEFYGVTVDFLLGKSDESTAENVALCAALGLSEVAVMRIKQACNIGAGDALNGLLSSTEMIHALSELTNLETLRELRGSLAVMTQDGLDALQEGRDAHATFYDVANFVRVYVTGAKEALSKAVDEAAATIMNGGLDDGENEKD